MAKSQSQPNAQKPKLQALYCMAPIAYNSMFGKFLHEIGDLVNVYAPLQSRKSIAEDPSVLAKMEILFSGWGGPKMDEAFLKAAPNLKAVFYSGGSMRQVATDAFWASGIPITCALEANGYSVANYAISQILWLLRRGWYYALKIREEKAWPQHIPVPGDYQSTVGIISLGTIARRVCKVLHDSFDVKLLAYSTSANPQTARELGLEYGSLEDVFRKSDVVSLHTGWLKETEGMITGDHFRMMKQGASFINNARGAVIRQDEMILALRDRPDIWAVLDVTWPEPPPADSPLFTLPNVVMTPHIGGPLDGECLRNGKAMLDDLKLFLAGKPMTCQIGAERARRLA
jgi:phosphoglycerate dehydrogenase-like enzyme